MWFAVQLRIGTHYDGVRVEAQPIDIEYSEAELEAGLLQTQAVLRVENGFADPNVAYVRSWGAARCVISREEGGRYGIDMTDASPDSVYYVWWGLLGDLRVAHVSNLLPHPWQSFAIENTCGACIATSRLDLEGFRKVTDLRRKRVWAAPASTDLITTLSGTFAPCTNQQQVDFRGVRSIRALSQDWKLISGLTEEADTRMTVYMVVLKGNIGLPVLLFDYATTLPPGITPSAGTAKCYLAQRLVPRYVADFTQHEDICQCIELQRIQWDAFLTPKGLMPLSKARGSAHISRRGGVMLRLVFPRSTTWNETLERETLEACDSFLVLLRTMLLGKPDYCQPLVASSV